MEYDVIIARAIFWLSLLTLAIIAWRDCRFKKVKGKTMPKCQHERTECHSKDVNPVDCIDCYAREAEILKAKNERLMDKVNLLVIRRDTLNRKRLGMEDALQDMSEKFSECQDERYKYANALHRIRSAPTQLPATVLIKVAGEALAGKTSQGFHDVEEFYSDDTNSQGIDK